MGRWPVFSSIRSRENFKFSQVEVAFEKANEFITNQKKKTADAPDKDAWMLNAYHFLTAWLVQITEDVAERV